VGVDEMELHYDKSCEGITQKSLKRLIWCLTEWACDRLTVVEVPVEQVCCGFLVVNHDRACASWSGDGFRMDCEGEGGAGYITAQAFMDILGLTVEDTDDLLGFRSEGTVVCNDAVLVPELTALALGILQVVDATDQKLWPVGRPSDLQPRYIRDLATYRPLPF